MAFFSELSLETLVSPFQFFVVLSTQNSFPLQGFRFPHQKSDFFGTYSRFLQAAKMVLASIKGQKWFFNKQKSNFFRMTTELTAPKATLQRVLQSSKPLQSLHTGKLFQPLPSCIEQRVGSVFLNSFFLNLLG